MNGITIGWATRDITPEARVRIMGQFHVRVSTGIENPLTCTAMAIEENGGAHLVLVSVDDVYSSTSTSVFRVLAMGIN